MIKNRHWKMSTLRVMSYWSGWEYVLIQEVWNDRQILTILTRTYKCLPKSGHALKVIVTLRLLFNISGYLPLRIRSKYYG